MQASVTWESNLPMPESLPISVSVKTLLEQ